MLFKRMRLLFLFSFVSLVFVFTMSACSEKNPPEIEQDFTDPTIVRIKSCFSSYSEKIERYLQGNLSSQQINNFWICHIDLVEIILDYRKESLKGEPQNTFAANEVEDILKRFLPKSSPVLNKDIYSAAFKFKRLILGGDDKTLKREELQLLIDKLRSYQKASLQLQENIPVLGRYINNIESVSYSEMKEAWGRIEPEIKQIISELFTGQVTFRDLRDVLVQFIPSDTTRKQVEILAEALDKYTAVFVGPNKTANDPNVIDSFLNLGGLYIHGSIGWQSWLNGQENSHLIGLLEKATRSLRSSLNLYPEKEIPGSQWRELFQLATKFVGGNDDLVLKGFNSTWLLINEKFLGGKGGDFTLGELNEVERGLLAWKVSLNSYAEVAGLTADCESIEKLDFNDDLRVNNHFVHCSSLTYGIDSVGRLQFSHELKKVDQISEQSFKSMNVTRVFLKPFYRVYGENIYRLNLTQLKVMFEEILSPWQDIIGDNFNVRSFYKKTLLETDLLTAYGDGDGHLSLFELSMFIQMAESGFAMMKKTFSFFDPGCFRDGQIDKNCLIEKFIDLKAESYSNFPEFLKYADKFDQDFISEYLNTSLSVVADLDSTTKLSVRYISKIDVLEMYILWHYNETYFQRFDINKSENLSYAEVEKSFELSGPVLLTLFDVLFPGIESEQALSIYSFLITKGYLVNDEGVEDPNENIVYQHWWQFPEKRKTKASRYSLIKVLAVLSRLSK